MKRLRGVKFIGISSGGLGWSTRRLSRVLHGFTLLLRLQRGSLTVPSQSWKECEERLSSWSIDLSPIEWVVYKVHYPR